MIFRAQLEGRLLVSLHNERITSVRVSKTEGVSLGKFPLLGNSGCRLMEQLWALTEDKPVPDTVALHNV